MWGKNFTYINYKGQKFSQIQKKHLNVNVLFSDPLFPPDSSSIGSFSNLEEEVEWKRPKDLCESPRLIDGELQSNAVVAGKLSSKWFVSACTILAGISELCHKVIPECWKQEWNAEKAEEYTGIFHFHFWRYGQWIDVVIDDLLPTFENQILGTHSTKPGEFWIPLLEKAYAKLHGSYEALQGGHLSDALVDFTGGVSEVIDLRTGDYSNSDEQSTLFALLDRELTHHCIVCASVAPSNETEPARTEIGLHEGEPYMITAVKKISVGDTGLRKLFKGRVKLCIIRLRDLHQQVSTPVHTCVNEESGEQGDNASSGRGSANGSTKSERSQSELYSLSKLTRLLSSNQEWAKVKDSDLHKLGLTCDSSGEFWMPLEDFVTSFSYVTICHLFNTNIFALNKTWKEASFRGTWSTGAKGTKSDRAGGCSDFPETFLRNPQYIFDIIPFEEEIVVQMLQWDSTVLNQAAGYESLLITFQIIRVEENRKYRLHKMWQHTPTVVSFNPVRKREIFYRGSLTRGRYIILPTTHRTGEIGGYFLRIFSSSDINMRELKHDVPSKTCLCCTAGYPIWATVIVIHGAQDLKKVETFGAGDTFCRIKCEGKTAKTHVVKNSTYPSWDRSYVFYRKNTAEPVEIQVYNHKMLRPNKFVGQVQLPAPVNQSPTPLTAELLDKSVGETSPTQGSLLLDIFTSDNFWEV